MSEARRWIQLSGARISCLEWVPDQAPSGNVLLLHGAGIDCARLAWGHLGPGLAASGYRVLAPDLPGFGESPAAAWQSTQANLLACVTALVDDLGLADLTIGGTSMGGALSLGYGLRHPERVSAVAVASCAGLADRVIEGRFALPVQALTRLMALTGMLDVGARWRRLDRGRLAAALGAVLRRPGSVTDEVLDIVSREVRLGHGSVANMQWQRSEMLWTRARTVYAGELAGFRKPVLMLHGSDDTGVPVAAAERAARVSPQATLVVVEGAGHWVTRDAPDEVRAAMLGLLDRSRP